MRAQRLIGPGRDRGRDRCAGKERFERAELLGDDKRRVIRQHDAAGANTDVRVPPARWPMTTDVAALAIPGML